MLQDPNRHRHYHRIPFHFVTCSPSQTDCLLPFQFFTCWPNQMDRPLSFRFFICSPNHDGRLCSYWLRHLPSCSQWQAVLPCQSKNLL